MKGATIIANNISVTLEGTHLLQDVSFSLGANEHLAIIGSSGSGKTTLAKVLTGQVFAKGSVTINWDETSSLQKKVVLIEQRNQFKNLSHTSDFYYQQRFNSFDAADAQTVWQELQNIGKNKPDFEIENLLQQFGLNECRNAPLIQLSSGENKRFQIIKAVLLQPQILILDAPFTGLDVNARKRLHGIINELARNGTKIIMVTDTHQLPDCITHVALLDEGRMECFIKKEEWNAGLVLHEKTEYTNIYSLPMLENEEHYEQIVNMQNVNVQYGNKTILNNINWQIKSGDKWLLKGSNGAGKSTLLSLINGDNPQAYKNEIYLFDKRRGSGESIWDIKQKIGFVSPELHAFYDKATSCFNTIASGFFDTVGLFKKLSPQQHEQVQQWIHFLQLSSVQNKLLLSLSFGTQRLILLARALVKNPLLLILDEPCQGLDDEQKEAFVNLVNNICEQFHKTLIYVSHYDDEIPACVENVMELKNGEQKIHSVKKQIEFI